MRSARLAVTVFAGAVLSLGVGASDARPARGDQVTISMLTDTTDQPGYNVLIPNFERAYPNITVNVTYAATTTAMQLETTELAAGNAPDILYTYPGCGNSVAACVLAKAGDLAPMIEKPWTKRSLPFVTSLDKYGQGLVVFTPQVAPYGIFTNDDLFKKLGLKVPETFSQLLTVCQKAKAAGTAAVIWPGGSGVAVSLLVNDLAATTVFGKDKHWTSKLRAGAVTFDGASGWHQAVQELVDMNNAGCFQPGVTGTALGSSIAEFAQGQGLMTANVSAQKGLIDSSKPQFAYSFDPFPGGAAPSQTRTLLNLSASLSVNAHSSAQNQAAAQEFVDFVARPKQDALFAQIVGGVTQYEFLKGQIPSFMSALTTVAKKNEFVVNPVRTWWNASVQLTLEQDGIGVITGQRSIDDVLTAMDAAWKQGPS